MDHDGSGVKLSFRTVDSVVHEVNTTSEWCVNSASRQSDNNVSGRGDLAGLSFSSSTRQFYIDVVGLSEIRTVCRVLVLDVHNNHHNKTKV